MNLIATEKSMQDDGVKIIAVTFICRVYKVTNLKDFEEHYTTVLQAKALIIVGTRFT